MVCLTLTFLAFIFQDALAAYVAKPLEDLLSLTIVFQNPILAAAYLSIPYILMLMLDVYAKRKHRKDENPKIIEPAQVGDTHIEDTRVEEQETQATIPAT